jgi:HlyD family secretion protein
MKFKLGWGLAVLLVAAVALGGWWSQRGAETDAGYKTAKLERGPLLAAVSSSGTVNPVRQVVIGSQVSGQIKEMRVDFNSEVRQGQVIARIDPQVFTYRVNQATADLESTRAAVLNAQANVGAATAAVSRARLDADNAQRDRLRKQELLDKQFVSQADFENSRNLAGTLAEALKVSLAQLEVARAQVVSAQAVVRQREAALSQARFDLERTEIRSPVDGVVIKRSVDVGQTVAASLQAPELFIIARDLSDMQVEAAIDEADIARVRIDQKVTFTIDAFAGRSFEGRVGQIRKAAVSAQNVVTYTVVVAFANPNAAVLPGMTANVRIVTEVRDNVLKVPNAALRVRLPGIEPVDLVASAPRDAAASAASAAAAAASQPSQPQRAAGVDGGGRAPTRGRIHILGPDGKPRAFFVRLGVSDGLATELLIGAGTAGQPDADLIKEGAEVVIGASKPAGAPPGAARTGPGGAPRAPF